MEENEVTREFHYTNGEITVVWKPAICQGSTFCWRGLPEVFRHNQRPWIDMSGANTDEIIEQVSRCPSGALSIVFNKDL